MQVHNGAEVVFNGGFLDSRRDVPDLTADEVGRVEGLIAQKKQAAMPLAMQRRFEHRTATISRRLPEMMKAGLSATEAEHRIGACVDAALAGTLLADFEVTVVHEDGKQEIVTVGAVLANRDKWEGKDCLDPINPSHRNYSPDARLFIQNASPILYSLDGLQVYRLKAQIQQLTVCRGNRGQLVESVADLVAGLDNVFMTDTGPVMIDGGRQLTLTTDRLMNVVGSNVTLSVQTAKGLSPTDLSREVAGLVLAALNT